MNEVCECGLRDWLEVPWDEILCGWEGDLEGLCSAVILIDGGTRVWECSCGALGYSVDGSPDEVARLWQRAFPGQEVSGVPCGWA